jgi:uncharacterized membrane protein
MLTLDGLYVGGGMNLINMTSEMPRFLLMLTLDGLYVGGGMNLINMTSGSTRFSIPGTVSSSEEDAIEMPVDVGTLESL